MFHKKINSIHVHSNTHNNKCVCELWIVRKCEEKERSKVCECAHIWKCNNDNDNNNKWSNPSSCNSSTPKFIIDRNTHTHTHSCKLTHLQNLSLSFTRRHTLTHTYTQLTHNNNNNINTITCVSNLHTHTHNVPLATTTGEKDTEKKMKKKANSFSCCCSCCFWMKWSQVNFFKCTHTRRQQMKRAIYKRKERTKAIVFD